MIVDLVQECRTAVMTLNSATYRVIGGMVRAVKRRVRVGIAHIILFTCYYYRTEEAFALVAWHTSIMSLSKVEELKDNGA